MRLFRLLFVLLIVSTTLVSAQKVTGPETDISLPSDSTRNRPSEKIDSEDPDLELPDVLITGEDRYHRSVVNKKNVAPDSPQLLRPDSPYEPLSVWFKRQDEKPAAGVGQQTTQRRTWAQLTGGSFLTFEAEAGHWQQMTGGDFRVQGQFNRSSGSHPNSGQRLASLAGKIRYELQENVTAMADANYRWFGRRLYHTAFDAIDGERYGGSGRFGADLEYDINSLSNGNLGFAVSGMNMQTDTSGAKVHSVKDFDYDLHFGYSVQIRSTQLDIHGRYLRETYEVDSLSMKNGFGVIGVQLLQPIGSVFSAALGLDYQYSETDTLTQKSRLSPSARLNFMPTNYFGLTGQVSTGYQFRTFRDYWKTNPFTNSLVPLQPEEVRLGLHIRADLQFSEDVKLQAGFGREWLDDYHYWQADTTTHLLGLNRLGKAEITELKIGVIAEINEKTRLQGFYIDYSDRINRDDALPKLNRIPYLPDWRAPIRLTLQLLPDMQLAATADIVGPRKKMLTSTKTLSAYALMNLDLTKDFGDTYSAVLSVRNLFDADYSPWEGYRGYGVQILAGVHAAF